MTYLYLLIFFLSIISLLNLNSYLAYLFDSVAFSCLFYEMLSFPGMKENHFKTSCLIDTNFKGNKIYVINIY